MAWPESTAYCEAVQNPRVTFGDAELQAGQLATNLLGLPLVHVGNFAAVFQMRRPAGPPNWALKCFTRQVHGLRRRYQAIHAHLDGRRLPFMVQFAYQADGILVRGERYPLLKMDWVEGLRLDEFLGDCLGKPGAKGVLRRLSQMWLKLSVMLREAAVGHGDLQHGNVMLVPVPGSDALALKLIDYDGMYVLELAGQPPGEIGHPAYQHPGRTKKTGYGPEVDRFSHLVIYTTLQALMAGGQDLWQQFYNGDRLLLGPDDFRDPKNSAAFRALWQIDNQNVRALMGHLALAAAGPVESVPLLSELVSEAGVVELSAEQQSRVTAMLGLAVAGTPPSFGAGASGATAPEASSVAEVVGPAESVGNGRPVAAETVPLQAATGGRIVRDSAGKLISEADRMLVRMVGEENTILLAVLRPLAALGGLALSVVLLLVLWQVGLQLAARDSVQPASEVVMQEPAVPDPDIAPAVYRVRVAPPEALLTGSGSGFTIAGEGPERTVTVAAPDETTEIVLLAVLEGYEERRISLHPVSGQTEDLAIELVRMIQPAVYRVTLSPNEAELRAEGAGVSIAGTGSLRTVTIAEPDGERAIELVGSFSGYEDQRLELRPVAGESQDVTITLLASTITNSIEMRFQRIPAGEFLMGSPDSDRDARDEEKPQHRVRITQPFYLGVYPVTQLQWERVMGSNPSHFKGPEHPVERVSWNDCQEFIRRLNALPAERGNVYRLPTEAEWEYACRAGSTTVYSFGDSAASLGDYAWYSANSNRRTHPVDQKRPNAWGLYDMHGNVWEWCQDWYDSGYYASSPTDDPQGPARGSNRVYRGGGWNGSPGDCRSANRNGFTPSYRRDYLGFRLAFSSVDQSGR